MEINNLTEHPLYLKKIYQKNSNFSSVMNWV